MTDSEKPSRRRLSRGTQVIPSGQRRRRDDEDLIPTLTVAAGPGVGSVIRFDSLKQSRVVVGRTEEAQVVIPDPTLSTVHAEFLWEPDGAGFRMVLVDLESTNGSFVNGRAVDRAVLADGDRVELGGVVLRYQIIGRLELDERQRLLAKATEAEKDPLTGLGNRRFLDERLPELITKLQTRGLDLGVLVLDLDHFKGVNDRFGHLVGDEVLKLTARLIESRIRNSDVAVRYGGEEFVLFLPESELSEAVLVAERIRFSVATCDTTSLAEGLELTVSIGATQWVPGEPLATTIGRADQALYEAKSTGRNRVVSLSPVEPAPTAG